MSGWANLAFFIVLVVVAVLMWRFEAPTPERLPWLLWAPDALLAAWAIYNAVEGDYGTAGVALIVLAIWFARTYPQWRRRRTPPPLK